MLHILNHAEIGTGTEIVKGSATLDAPRAEDPDPDPVGSGDFWPVGSGSGTFFNGSGSYL